jgi:hypothetical protein
MLKVFLIWLAILAGSLALSAYDTHRYPRDKSIWTSVFMWTLILGVGMIVTQCLGGGGGDCEYGRTGARCY